LRLVLLADWVDRQSLFAVAAALVVDAEPLFFFREQRPGWRGKLGCCGDEAVLKRNGHVASSREKKGGSAPGNTKEINGRKERFFFKMVNLLLTGIYLMVGLDYNLQLPHEQFYKRKFYSNAKREQSKDTARTCC
jgi:hypothetical protein